MRRRRPQGAFSLFAFQDIITSVTGVIVLITLLLVLELIQRTKLSSTPGAPDSAADVAMLETLSVEAMTLRESLLETQEILGQIASLPADVVAGREPSLESVVQTLEIEAEELRAQLDAKRRQNQHIETQTQQFNEEVDVNLLEQRVEELEAVLMKLRTSQRVAYNPSPLARKAALLIDLTPTTIRVLEMGDAKPMAEFDSPSIQGRVRGFIAWARGRNPGAEYFVLLVRPKTLTVYEEAQEQLRKLGFDLGVDLLDRDSVILDGQAGEAKP